VFCAFGEKEEIYKLAIADFKEYISALRIREQIKKENKNEE
jgi:hypothetical protein